MSIQINHALVCLVNRVIIIITTIDSKTLLSSSLHLQCYTVMLFNSFFTLRLASNTTTIQPHPTTHLWLFANLPNHGSPSPSARSSLKAWNGGTQQGPNHGGLRSSNAVATYRQCAGWLLVTCKVQSKPHSPMVSYQHDIFFKLTNDKSNNTTQSIIL